MLTNYNIQKWLLYLLIGVITIAIGGTAIAVDQPHVVYNKATDSLSLKAQNASLKGLLARIGLLSGVEFLMDPNAERQISITIKDMPLEAGLKRIMKSNNLDHAMVFQKTEESDGAAAPLLVSVKVVPQGNTLNKNASLAPVVAVEGEVVIRSKAKRPNRDG